ncbi:hypothetical protein H0N99_02290 [Candidatus Micrarchaeota archaeon]|nr:hypothetical protein [Candidatus Micrarchaeota archaeon]
MERDTLIKVGALITVIFFTMELFTMRSAVTSSPAQSNQTSNETPVYGAGVANATLLSYLNYVSLFKQGADLSRNASIANLSNMDGVGFINNQSGAVTLVLNNGANVTRIAQEVKERFPDINVTASALFSIPSEVEFTTQLGKRNVSISFLLQIQTEPDIDVGDNVTVSLAGILYGDQFSESPTARIIPTENDVVTHATVSGVGDEYYAVVALPWERRYVNTTMIEGEFPATMVNVSIINYTPKSYVAVKDLSSASNDTVNKIGNLSYVEEVNGDVVYVRDDMNNSEKLTADLKGILGNNTTIDYPVSTMPVIFSSANVSSDDILKPTGGKLNLYRTMFLKLGDTVAFAGADYNVPSNTTFTALLLNSSYSVGKNVTVEIGMRTIGKRIVSLELKNILR